MSKGINGGNIYTITFSGGRSLDVEALDREGANYIGSNSSSLYGWGSVVDIVPN
jgi:hypothetical protein